MAKTKGEPYILKEIYQKNIKNCKELLGFDNRNWAVIENKEHIHWNKIKYDHSGEELSLKLYQKRRGKARSIHDLELSYAYKELLPITAEKKKDLMSLCAHWLIPEVYARFYESLKAGRLASRMLSSQAVVPSRTMSVDDITARACQSRHSRKEERKRERNEDSRKGREEMKRRKECKSKQMGMLKEKPRRYREKERRKRKDRIREMEEKIERKMNESMQKIKNLTNYNTKISECVSLSPKTFSKNALPSQYPRDISRIAFHEAASQEPRTTLIVDRTDVNCVVNVLLKTNATSNDIRFATYNDIRFAVSNNIRLATSKDISFATSNKIRLAASNIRLAVTTLGAPSSMMPPVSTLPPASMPSTPYSTPSSTPSSNRLLLVSGVGGFGQQYSGQGLCPGKVQVRCWRGGRQARLVVDKQALWARVGGGCLTDLPVHHMLESGGAAQPYLSRGLTFTCPVVCLKNLLRNSSSNSIGHVPYDITVAMETHQIDDSRQDSSSGSIIVFVTHHRTCDVLRDLSLLWLLRFREGIITVTGSNVSSSAEAEKSRLVTTVVMHYGDNRRGFLVNFVAFFVRVIDFFVNAINLLGHGVALMDPAVLHFGRGKFQSARILEVFASAVGSVYHWVGRSVIQVFSSVICITNWTTTCVSTQLSTMPTTRTSGVAISSSNKSVFWKAPTSPNTEPHLPSNVAGKTLAAINSGAYNYWRMRRMVSTSEAHYHLLHLPFWTVFLSCFKGASMDPSNNGEIRGCADCESPPSNHIPKSGKPQPSFDMAASRVGGEVRYPTIYQ
ncbi:hypothetical protein PR048_011313 [Dryococelus australis]|uniref:Uncharacterized protein n=1 Tax=Dryococelus australis TaxID=614101 RepID=A0ABQ9HLA2_9NEOP|nr:hypothetical protein PR048_011313 [Dryococelus australis]